MDTRYVRAFLLSASLVATLSLFACAVSSRSPDMRKDAEAYIRTHITELSPQPAVLGGTFYVTDIQWESPRIAVVSYEDGHIVLKGRTVVTAKKGQVEAAKLVIMPVENEKTASSAFVRPRAKLGQFCGGIAGILCEDGLNCRLDGTYPDAGGTCVKQ
jgi:hypothetical protein